MMKFLVSEGECGGEGGNSPVIVKSIRRLERMICAVYQWVKQERVEQGLLANLQWEVFGHLPYSPDLTPFKPGLKKIP